MPSGALDYAPLPAGPWNAGRGSRPGSAASGGGSSTFAGSSSCQAAEAEELELIVEAKNSIIRDLGLQLDALQGKLRSRPPNAAPCGSVPPASVGAGRGENSAAVVRAKRLEDPLALERLEELEGETEALEAERLRLHTELADARRLADAAMDAAPRLSHETRAAAHAHQEIQDCLSREADLRGAFVDLSDMQGMRLGRAVEATRRDLELRGEARAQLTAECQELRTELRAVGAAGEGARGAEWQDLALPALEPECARLRGDLQHVLLGSEQLEGQIADLCVTRDLEQAVAEQEQQEQTSERDFLRREYDELSAEAQTILLATPASELADTTVDSTAVWDGSQELCRATSHTDSRCSEEWCLASERQEFTRLQEELRTISEEWSERQGAGSQEEQLERLRSEHAQLRGELRSAARSRRSLERRIGARLRLAPDPQPVEDEEERAALELLEADVEAAEAALREARAWHAEERREEEAAQEVLRELSGSSPGPVDPPADSSLTEEERALVAAERASWRQELQASAACEAALRREYRHMRGELQSVLHGQELVEREVAELSDRQAEAAAGEDGPAVLEDGREGEEAMRSVEEECLRAREETVQARHRCAELETRFIELHAAADAAAVTQDEVQQALEEEILEERRSLEEEQREAHHELQYRAGIEAALREELLGEQEAVMQMRSEAAELEQQLVSHEAAEQSPLLPVLEQECEEARRELEAAVLSRASVEESCAQQHVAAEATERAVEAELREAAQQRAEAESEGSPLEAERRRVERELYETVEDYEFLRQESDVVHEELQRALQPQTELVEQGGGEHLHTSLHPALQEGDLQAPHR